MGAGAHNPRYEVVFFDLYGTLIDIRTDEQSETAWQALYDCVCELGADYESVDEMRERFEKLEAREMVHQADRAIVRNGWDEFDILPVYRSLLMNRSEEAEKKLALPQAALKAAWAFRQGSTSMIRLYPGALDMIEALQEAGVVVVGNDEANDIIGANSAGLDAAYFRTEISPMSDPPKSEHAVCSFTGADYDGLLKFVLNA